MSRLLRDQTDAKSAIVTTTCRVDQLDQLDQPDQMNQMSLRLMDACGKAGTRYYSLQAIGVVLLEDAMSATLVNDQAYGGRAAVP